MKISKSFAGIFLAFFSILSQAQDVYHLNPGDVLRISVWNEEALQEEVLVLPDGTISFPLVGLLLVLSGWAVVLSNLAAVGFLPVFVAYMTRFQIAPEERALHAKFGCKFMVYKDSVRRWL